MKKLTYGLIFGLLLLMLAACGGSEDEGAAVDATSEPQEAVVESTAEVEEAPPAAVVVEEPTATAVPAVAPTVDRTALVRFRDSETARSGSLDLLSNELPAPPAGSHYQLWLFDAAQNPVNIGRFDVVDGSVEFNATQELHLLGSYAGGFISLEPDSAGASELGPIVYYGVVPPGSLLHIRHVVFGFAANPNGKGFLVGALDELQIARDHADLMLNELAADNLSEARRHAEHVINILSGETGELFGDLDGDGVPQNPGDGLGVINYVAGGIEHANLAANAEDATFEVQLHAEHVEISGNNTLARLETAVDQALRILSADSAAEAQSAADELAAVLDLVLAGEDLDGDGAVSPIEGEGGLDTAYVHALNMGSIELVAGDGTVSPLPQPTAVPATAEPVEVEPTPAPIEAPATPEPQEAPATPEPQEAPVTPEPEEAPVTPEPEEAPITPEPEEAPAGGSVTINMLDFEFGQREVRIAAGTTVTWFNAGERQHSATADDGSFNTGLYGAGQQAEVTFNTPGTYTYYCELHGAPGGQGMAATIVVE